MKRVFDLAVAILALIFWSPFLIFFALWIMADSRGGPFFGQQRVGRNGHLFTLWKLRTMRPGSESSGQLTIGSRDPRITHVGYFLRQSKLDELPQLWNVLIGEMSIVGPRPEVPKYVKLYTSEQKKVLSVRPGITDYASLLYYRESDLLRKSDNPERTYVEQIMPAKLSLNLEYLAHRSVAGDVVIAAKTAWRMLGFGPIAESRAEEDRKN